MKNIIIVFVLIFVQQIFVAKNANAAKSVKKSGYTCEGRYPLLLKSEDVKNISLQKLNGIFRNSLREELVDLLWLEIKSKPNANPNSLLMPVLYFLAGTEKGKDLRGFYKTLIYLYNDTRSIEETLQQWPKRPALQEIKLDHKKWCDIYNKAVNSL